MINTFANVSKIFMKKREKKKDDLFFFFFSFVLREYPCDHYISIINVTLMNTGCPRAPVHDEALQLLQLLDQRFFGNVGPLPATEPETGTYICSASYFNSFF